MNELNFLLQIKFTSLDASFVIFTESAKYTAIIQKKKKFTTIVLQHTYSAIKIPYNSLIAQVPVTFLSHSFRDFFWGS